MFRSEFAIIFIWVRKFDSDSFTETKNWRGRNEIIETSGRLHPSWPQNKRLYTPWTKDYRHTGQDRWIQTELAFTLAKNATKPNPVEIILQTTRKENNWKTKETTARTAVTLETERIKLVQSMMFMMMMMMMMMIMMTNQTLLHQARTDILNTGANTYINVNKYSLKILVLNKPYQLLSLFQDFLHRLRSHFTCLQCHEWKSQRN